LPRDSRFFFENPSVCQARETAHPSPYSPVKRWSSEQNSYTIDMGRETCTHCGQEFLIVNDIPMTEQQYRDGSKIQ
jgi:rRNA maturation protein Nop10